MGWWIRPIGHVIHVGPGDRWSRRSMISIEPDLREGLRGLSEYSHAFIIYILHDRRGWDGRLLVRPHGLEDHEPVGIFATRNPNRPNPIGLSVVEIVDVDEEEGVLEVMGLDALSGSPVMDIKPYDYWDIVWEPRVPDWWCSSINSWPSWSPRPGRPSSRQRR